MEPVKLVLDTNVYLMSLARRDSFLDKIIRTAVETGQIKLYSSPEIIQELEHVLENKFRLARPIVAEALQTCESTSQLVRPRRRLTIVRDPDDNKIVECAVEAKADVIVSADKDLLKLKHYNNIQIIHPNTLKHWLKPKT